MFTLANVKLECVVEFLSQQFDDLAQTKNELEVYNIKIYQLKLQLSSLIKQRMMFMIVRDE